MEGEIKSLSAKIDGIQSLINEKDDSMKVCLTQVEQTYQEALAKLQFKNEERLKQLSDILIKQQELLSISEVHKCTAEEEWKAKLLASEQEIVRLQNEHRQLLQHNRALYLSKANEKVKSEIEVHEKENDQKRKDQEKAIAGLQAQL